MKEQKGLKQSYDVAEIALAVVEVGKTTGNKHKQGHVECINRIENCQGQCPGIMNKMSINDPNDQNKFQRIPIEIALGSAAQSRLRGR